VRPRGTQRRHEVVRPVGERRRQTDDVSDRRELSGLVVRQRRRPAEGIGDRRDAQRIRQILVRNRGHPADGVRDRDEPELPVPGEREALTERVDELAQKYALIPGRAAVGKRIHLRAVPAKSA
jgi:hypothetical protein